MAMERVLICTIVICFHSVKMLINKFFNLPFILFSYFFGHIKCILGDHFSRSSWLLGVSNCMCACGADGQWCYRVCLGY